MKQTILLILLSLTLGGCGVKPGAVDGKDTHPRTYPDMRTDPLPHGGPAATTIR